MTNEEFLLHELCSQCRYVHKDIVKQIYDLIKEKDLKLFSINVSDNHDEEQKVNVKIECSDKLDKIVGRNADISNAVSHIYVSLLPGIYPTGDFYKKHFFEMDKEYKGDNFERS